MERRVDVAILGAGTAGLNAMAQVRRQGRSWALINGGSTGTTCARVGCMPSKALIHAAELVHSGQGMGRIGIGGGDALAVDIPAVLSWVRSRRDRLVSKLRGRTTERMGDEYIEGYAEVVAPDRVRVGDLDVVADRIVIATGSSPVVPAAWRAFGDRVLTTDELFEREDLPRRLAVLGLGVVGIELGQALARLGLEVSGFDMLERVGGLDDPLVSQVAVRLIGEDLPLHLGKAAELSEAPDGSLRVRAGDVEVEVDAVVAALGRRPNVARLGLERLGVPMRPNGVPEYDPHTQQVGDLPIFLAGDADGDRPVLHEAGDEGRVAGYNAAREEPVAFSRKPPLAITFTDPNLCQVGARWSELDEAETAVGTMSLEGFGRAFVNDRDDGIVRLYAARESGRLLGASLATPRGEHLAHLVALALQKEMTALDALRMPFYHPVWEEALQGALRDLLHELGEKTPAPADLIPG